jgi:hypothetical protein
LLRGPLRVARLPDANAFFAQGFLQFIHGIMVCGERIGDGDVERRLCLIVEVTQAVRTAVVATVLGHINLTGDSVGDRTGTSTKKKSVRFGLAEILNALFFPNSVRAPVTVKSSLPFAAYAAGQYVCGLLADRLRQVGADGDTHRARDRARCHH